MLPLCECVKEPKMFTKRKNPSPYFGYTEEDVDWGCTYRSVQNVCVGVGFSPVPSLGALVHRVARRQWGEWGEPAMFTDMFRSHGFVAHTFLLRDVEPKFTPPDWYDVHLARLPRNFFQPGFCYVVDDSVSTYAVVTRGNKLWWVDPHVDPDTRVVPEPFQYAVHMGRGKGWMILRVACR